MLDAVLQRAKTAGVRLTMCAGEVLYQDGRFTRVDRDAALEALHQDLQKALSNDEVERRGLAKDAAPARATLLRRTTSIQLVTSLSTGKARACSASAHANSSRRSRAAAA